MHRLLVLGILVAAASVLGGFGTGTHSAVAASVLCKANAELCASKDVFPHETEFIASPDYKEWPGAILGDTNTQQCTTNIYGHTTGTTGEGDLVGKTWKVTFSSCAGPKCQGAASLNLPWKLLFVAGETSSENEIRLQNGGTGTPAIRVSCEYFGIKYTCTFAATGSTALRMPVVLGEPWVVAENGPTDFFLSEGHALCTEETLHWEGVYDVMTPQALYLTHG